MRIAVIGAGVSGLVAAYRLHADHLVTVFEANDYPGGHTNTVEVVHGGERHAIDTGFIVFNDWTYPAFSALLKELNVASQPTTMSFSVRDDDTGLEYSSRSPNTLFAQRRNLVVANFWRMLADIWRFNRISREMGSQCDARLTVGEFLSRYKFSPEFARYYLLPMGAAIWSCPMGTFAQFPVRFVVEFYDNHGLLNVLQRPTWRVIQGGSRTYVRALIRNFRDRIRLCTPVHSVERRDYGAVVRPRGAGAEIFDHVIFACHSDQALRILGDDATAVERDVLSAFPYSKNIAVLHTDTTLLPRSRRAWASWNFLLQANDDAPASVTYNMNSLQGIRSQHTFCVSLNESRISPDKVLGRYEYHHPIFTGRREAAQARYAELVNSNRTSFCGAYWRNGFHEDGVLSALAVVNSLRNRNTSCNKQPSLVAGVLP